jgi:LacI family transcriptional regulator
MSITEVSKVAGVSIATVSRVINNRRWVAPETAALVRNAMKEVGYRPSPSKGRGHRGAGNGSEAVAFQATSTLVSLLFPDPEARAMKTVLSGRVAHGISQHLSRHGLNLALSLLADWEEMPTAVAKRQVCGVILRGTVPVEHLFPLMQGLPCVTIFETPCTPTYGDQVLEDNAAIGALGLNYLRQQGCRSVGFINRDVLHPSYASRGDGFARAARGEGMEARLVTRAGTIPELVDELLESGKPVDGIFVPGNEDQVELVHRELTRRGIRPGRDFPFIGVVYDAARLRTLDADLPNIDICPEEIGAAAAETLLWRLANPLAPRRRTLIDPMLVSAPYSPGFSASGPTEVKYESKYETR